MFPSVFLTHGARLLLLLALALPLSAATETTDWPDADGTRFTGKPVDIFGSFALFKTERTVLKRVPLRALSPEDCQRFYRALPVRPARAAHWSDAKSKATGDLVGNVLRLEGQYRKLVPADLVNLPEPELLIVFYGYQNLPNSWTIVNNIGPNYRRLQSIYPGLAHGIFYGLAPTSDEHESMAITAWMPWLVTKYARQDKLTSLKRYAYDKTPYFAVMTRHGDLIIGTEPLSFNVVRGAIDDLLDVLWTMHPYNSRAVLERAAYWRAVRPLQYATGSIGPELLGSPLRTDGLNQRGITRVDAQLEVDAAGKVTNATMLPGATVPEALTKPLLDALRRSSVFLPAMENGQAVAASYHYTLEVPPANAQSALDAIWLDRSIRGEVPLRDWLLLTSIPVNQKDFDDVEKVGPDGFVTMRAMEVSKAKISLASQSSAFRSDFFGENGASSVAPEVGQTQEVDGHTYKWRAVKSLDGFVDMQASANNQQNYCVGYAWTEIEVSADLNAWLGIGSDDGIKVWLNGELVNDKWRHRISQLDDDIVPLKLKAGKNHLLLKVQNMARNWNFVARLRFPDR